MITLNRNHKDFSLQHEILATLSPTGVSMQALVADFGLQDQKHLRKILAELATQGFTTIVKNNRTQDRQVILERNDWPTARLEAQIYWQLVNKPCAKAA